MVFYRSTLGYLWPLREGHTNAIRYIGTLEHSLIDVRMDMSEIGIDDPVVMQDNSSIHTSKLAQAWFKDNDWAVAKHPAYSSDLNPIEHVWACQRHQYARKPEGSIGRCTGGEVSLSHS